jgi:peptidyl-prolyl cis-trans isomerase B (cyclophilin B)
MIQCGGMIADMSQKDTRDPIVNEADNGLKNNRGTLAMARTNDPNSATAQFFVNHKDNDFLNYTGPGNPGYAVFGKVTDGMDVVDAIAEVETGSSGFHDDVPTETITIESAEVIQ